MITEDENVEEEEVPTLQSQTDDHFLHSFDLVEDFHSFFDNSMFM